MKKVYNISSFRFFIILFWGVAFSSLKAQWSTDPLVNNAISTFNFYDKFVPVIVSDGSGGAIIAWQDSRNDGSFFDIYAQRINSEGIVLWTTDGVAISTGIGDRRAPAIVSDGIGGAIITWIDSRSGFNLTDIYAQRIDSSGVVQWTTDGLAICTEAASQGSQAIISDGSGGAIITWVDGRSGNGTGDKIYAQRIDSSGSIHSGWITDGVAICSNLPNTRNHPTIVGDGLGGAIITWSDYRNSSTYDIYAQKINASGIVQWDANGVAICTFPEMQGKPKIVRDGESGAIIAWEDTRTTQGDIYAQRIDASGNLLWALNGLSICSQPPYTQANHNIISNGSGGAIITWYDNRNGNYDIYAQAVNGAGLVQWIVDGIVVCSAIDNQYFPALVADGLGGAIITWHDNRLGTSAFDIYAQRINSEGATQWTTDGAPISTEAHWQGYTSITSDGTSGAIITWYDYRSGFNSDIYAQQISANGVLGEGQIPVELVSFSGLILNDNVILNWNTATELNNSGFEIQRLKDSEIEKIQYWENIGFVNGNGTSSETHSYSFQDANPLSGKYKYRLKQIDFDGTFEYSSIIEVEIVKPEIFILDQNYPNPFNPSTIITWQSPVSSHQTLKIYDILGNEVATLVNEYKSAGNYEVEFDASKLSSGIYLYKLQAGEFISTKKMILIK